MTVNGISIGQMKMPWDKNLVNTTTGVSIATFNSGPHGANDTTYGLCNPYSLSRLSGIDFGMENGTKVLAVQAGTIISATASTYYKSTDEYEVTIDHGGWTTRYWHLRSITEAKSLVGKIIAQGQVIGESGKGHLHLELQSDNAGGAGGSNVLSWHGISIDSYTVYSVLDGADETKGLNYQGTLMSTEPQTQNKADYTCSNYKKRLGARITAKNNSQLETTTPYPPVPSTNQRADKSPATIDDISVALIIDGTGSMETYDPNSMRKAAGKVFIDSMIPGRNKVAVVGFDS